MSEFEIYSMHLHETIRITADMKVTRVPGGWLYQFSYDCVADAVVFVPFHNEFQRAKSEGDSRE